MKTQQQAEREEQQRIKSLVLNYDLRDEEQDGEDHFHCHVQPNLNTRTKSSKGIEKTNPSNAKLDKAGTTRSKQRARKLQLSDVDWYDGEIHSDVAVGNHGRELMNIR